MHQREQQGEQQHMLSRLLELKRQTLPELREARILLIAFLAIAFFAICKGIYLSSMAAPLFLLASLSVATIWFAGVRFLLPLYFVLTLSGPIVLPGVPASINQGVALLLFAAFFKDLPFRRMSLKLSIPLVLFFSYLLYVLTVSVVMKLPEGIYPIQIAYYLVPTGIMILMFYEKAALKEFLTLVSLFGAGILILPGLVEYLTGINLTPLGPSGTTNRINGFLKDSILFAFMCVWIIPPTLTLFIEGKNHLTKSIYLSIVAGLVIISLLTKNRQTPLALAPMIFIFLVLIRYKYRPQLLGASLIASAALTPLVLNKVIDRLFMTKNIFMDLSYLFRHDKIYIALDIWKEHPWFGIGLDNFSLLWDQYRPIGLYIVEPTDQRKYFIDMGYVQILTEFGLVGLVLFFTLFLATFIHFIKIYRMSLRLKDTWYTNILAALAALFFQVLLLNTISDAFLRLPSLLVFGIFFAVSTSIHHQYKKQNQGAEQLG